MLIYIWHEEGMQIQDIESHALEHRPLVPFVDGQILNLLLSIAILCVCFGHKEEYSDVSKHHAYPRASSLGALCKQTKVNFRSSSVPVISKKK